MLRPRRAAGILCGAVAGQVPRALRELPILLGSQKALFHGRTTPSPMLTRDEEEKEQEEEAEKEEEEQQEEEEEGEEEGLGTRSSSP